VRDRHASLKGVLLLFYVFFLLFKTAKISSREVSVDKIISDLWAF